jgi:N-acetylmuramoyl-L-alanine amidase
MKKAVSNLLLVLVYNYSFSQNTDTTNTYKVNYYTQKVNAYLDKEKALMPYYSIDRSGIKIFSSAKNKSMHVAELQMNWKEIDDAKTRNVIPVSQTKILQGLKIAIDPGHMADNFEMGEIETKCIKFQSDSLTKLPAIQFAEGMLSYATAMALKEKLEQEGAEILLTRTDKNCAFKKSYQQWLKDDLKNTVDSLYKIKKITLSEKQYFLSNKATERDIFKMLFKDLELAKRAEVINNYHPDLTIIIHYNVDETNVGWNKPSNKNFNMTFVAGAFMKNDLSSPAKRSEFFRLITSDDLERSIALSSSVVKSFEKVLNVKTASSKDATYLSKGCLSTKAKGVYCRNLQLTRYIHSPLVYGETLYQDNIDECKLLNEESDKIKNKRIQQVADAYFQGILDYVNLRPPNN